MSELTVQIVREQASEGLADWLPAAVQIGERAGVILRQTSGTEVELYYAAQITRADVTTLNFEPVTEPAEQAMAFAEAVEALTICRRVAFEYETEQRQLHIEQLIAIRQYAITRHEVGDICQSGLNAFLETFGMEPYVPRLRVNYTISGSYEVQQRSADFAESDARDYLRPDLSNVDDVDHLTSIYEVTVGASQL